MPFIKNTNRKGYQQPVKNQKLFIGRLDELHFFNEDILKPDEPVYNIVSISGQAGVGKSTLVTRFIDEAGATNFKDYCLSVRVNERQNTPVSIMEKFAEQLSLEGDFTKALIQYNDALRKLQVERDNKRGAILRKTVTDITDAATKDIPFLGGVLSKGAELGIEYIAEEIHSHHLLKDAERLEDPVGDLTGAFVKELNKLAEIQVISASNNQKRKLRVILFFDTFEQLASTAVPWLLDYFLPMNISNNVILVIAGRDPLNHSLPDDPKRWLPYYDDNIVYPIFLDNFTKEETHLYLSQRGNSDPAYIATVWQLSQGLPLYLSLLTTNIKGELDPTSDVVANFLRWIPEDKNKKRNLALDAALLSRPFTQDDLNAFDYLPQDKEEQRKIYQWFVSLSFIRNSLQDGRYNYHNLVQELFCRYLHQNFSSEYFMSRKKLAHYYKDLLGKKHPEDTEKLYLPSEWSEIMLARAQQLFLLPDEESHVEAIEVILETYSSTKRTEEITRLLDNLAQEKLNNLANVNVRRICVCLSKYIRNSLDSNKLDIIKSINVLLEILTGNSSFPLKLLSELYFTRGKLYSSTKSYHQALNDFDLVVNFNPENVEAFISRADIHRVNRDYEKALIELNQALKLTSNPGKMHTIQEYRGSILIAMKNYEGASEAYTQSVMADPLCQNGWSHLVNAYISSGYSNSKIPSLLKSISPNYINPPDLFIRRAVAMRNIELYEEALEEINYAIISYHKNSELYVTRGNIYLSQKRYEEAIFDFNQAIHITPMYAIAILDLARAYNRSERYDKALEAYNHALEVFAEVDEITEDVEKAKGHVFVFSVRNRNKSLIYTFNYTAIFERGITLKSLGKLEEALIDLNYAADLEPRDAWTYFERGMLYKELSKYQFALADFDRAAELNSQAGHVAQKEKGVLLNSMGMHQEAAKSIIEAIKYSPLCKHCWNLLAETYQLTQPSNQVAGLLREAISLDKNRSAIAYRANAMQNQGLYEEALADLNLIVEQYSKKAPIIAQRGKCFFELRRYKEALDDIDLAITLDERLTEKLQSMRELALNYIKQE